ncbi:MAG: NAD(P)H-dependent oxidoreductase [Xanthomonadales bacterium]|nr:NAD(P)H-dependent oxidoreductase [Xanthomonadales bacterium]
MNLLHIDSSPLGQHSVSRQLTAALISRLQRQTPGAETVYRDLSAQPLPHWAPPAGTDTGAALDDQAVLDELFAADVVVIGAPMYNFSIPTQLKAWIDRIAVAGKTFRYTEKGPEGLVHGKTVYIVSTRGGAYSAAPQMDFQEAYLRQVLGFIGISDVRFVRAEGLNMGAEPRAAALASANEDIDRATAVALPLGDRKAA